MGNETFYCSCGEDFDERQLLESHKFKCPAIKKIQQEAGLKESNQQKCEKAFDETKTLCNYNRHIRPTLHKCDTCGDGFDRQRSLENHKHNCLSIKELQDEDQKENMQPGIDGTTLIKDQFKCGKCGRAFDTSKSYRLHLNHVHSKCGKRLATPSKLRSHQLIHAAKSTPLNEDSERNYGNGTSDGKLECDDCGKKFPAPSKLQRHKVVHTGEKPFSCKICGIKFTQKVNLQQHTKRLHEESDHQKNQHGPFRHECQDCGKKFRNPCHLQTHRVVHTGEKPFACETCSSRFTQKGDLKKHILRFHLQKSHNQKDRPRRFLKRNSHQKIESDRLHEIKPSRKDQKPVVGDPEKVSLLYCSCGQDFDERQSLDIHKQNCTKIK